MDSSFEIKGHIQAVLKFLSIRARSRKEILDYINKREKNQDVADAVMAYVDSHNLVNDADFALMWAQNRLRLGKGDIIIAMELRQKGIGADLIQNTISSIDIDAWFQAMDKVADKYSSKWQSLSGYKQKTAIYQVIYSRGFSRRHIDAFIQHRLK